MEEQIVIDNKILMNWNISKEPIVQIYNSACQIGDNYILKSGSNLEGLNNNILITKTLRNYNIPVASIIKTIDELDYILQDSTYYFLCEKIEGNHISDIYTENYKELSYLIGGVIGRLHAAFRKCQEEISCYDNNFYAEITGWVSQAFRDKEITSIPKDILDECILQLGEIYPRLPRQLIHRDMHLGNMLFEKNELTGYIDFDLSHINARVFDLCYMTSGFLIDNINDEIKTAKWFEILHNIVDGYNSIISLTEDEKRSIPIMMVAIEMLFTAYYANMNDKSGSNVAAETAIWLWENKERISL
jgi:Ser/Thr protein kinase RdoA (MazF antagonist)